MNHFYKHYFLGFILLIFTLLSSSCAGLFIHQTENQLSAPDKYVKATRKEFEDSCDSYFNTDSQIEEYCTEKNIPWEEQ